MMDYLAPAGTPINIPQLGKWLLNSAKDKNTLEIFSEIIKRDTGKKHCLFISSGRTALYLLLKCIYDINADPSKNQVIIPSYTCFSVPGSVIKAGLQVRICDVDPSTLSYDTKQLDQYDFSKVLAIVTANLYGIPDDLVEIERIAKKHNIYLVDDAAQSLGGTVAGRPSGSYGVAGIYSLDKGKNITSIQGGIIVTDSDDIAEHMKHIIDNIPIMSPVNLLSDCLKLIAYAMLLPPSKYWLINKLLSNKLGITPYTTDYPVHQYSRIMSEMALILYDKLPSITEKRVKNAKEIKGCLPNISAIKTIDYPDYIEPVFLRLPILINDKNKRGDIISALNSNGIGATASYPSSVAGIREIQDIIMDQDRQLKSGKTIADQIITLPTHPYTTPDHIKKICNIIENILGK